MSRRMIDDDGAEHADSLRGLRTEGAALLR